MLYIFILKHFQNCAQELTRRYCFISYVVFVSASPLSGCFPFSWFPVQPLLFTPKSLFLTLISRATWGSMRGTVRGVQGGGGTVWLGGVCILVSGVARAFSLTC